MTDMNAQFVARRVLKLLRGDEFRGVRVLQELETAISSISPLLRDAEKKSYRGPGVRIWLKNLSHALRGAEDLLESILFDAQNSGGGSSWKDRECFCWKSTNPAMSFQESCYQLKLEFEAIEAIVKDRTECYEFEEIAGEMEIGVPHDLVKELASSRSRFPGFSTTRDEDKREILKFLFSISERRIKIGFIAGRAVETSELARNVFDDERVQDYFEARIWIRVDRYDLGTWELVVASSTAGPKIDKSNVSTEELVELLRDVLHRKLYLVVFDGLPSYCFRKNLREYLIPDKTSKPGSRILAASDGKELSGGTGILWVYDLKERSEEESWDLLNNLALGGRDPEEFQVRIAKAMVKTFHGQLSIAEMVAIGGVLYFKESEEERWFFYENELIQLLHKRHYLQGRARFLKFAYDQLPTNLKQCFAYCSLFPKDHELDVQTLIKLWMAQGFVESSSDCEDLEELGYVYVLNLIRRCFFHEAKVNATGHVTSCRIRRFMHEIITQEVKTQCQFLTDRTEYDFGESICHFSFSSDEFPYEKMYATSTVRSILFPTQSCNSLVDEWKLRRLVDECRFLRALDMHGLSVEKIPDSIGNLKLLRYLDLSNNWNLEELPDTITNLVNLQTLKLSCCSRLKNLPTALGNLVKLRHLEIDGCSSLISLPRGICRLTNLRTLSLIILSENASKAKAEVEELQRLTHLREVRVKNLRHGMYGWLESLQNLRRLSIEWESRSPTLEDSKMRQRIPQLPDLEDLSLTGCYDLSYMFSLRSFPNNLGKLHLKRCVNCLVLPPLDGCVNLKMLVLDEMLDLEYITENFSKEVCASLAEVWLTELPELKGWWKTNQMATPLFSRLYRLVIEDCPKFKTIPLFPTLEEGLVLDSTSWEPFQSTMKLKVGEASRSSPASSPPLSKLTSLCIVAIENFNNSRADEIKWKTLNSLRMLKLDFLPKLDTLPEELQEVTTLQELHIWRSGVKSIPKWIGKLVSLERLAIRSCPSLKSLPKEIRKLERLKVLEIGDCQTLLRRCEEEIGADWYKISHIPKRRLGRISAK